jgi:transcriptional regulator with XRE-family HTH domain
MIKDLREAAGLTQQQLAKKLGYTTPQYISNLERNVTQVPVSKIRAFAEALDAPIEFFIEQRLENERKKINRVLGTK